MRRGLPDTVQGRTILVLLVGLGLFHLLSLWTYQIGVRYQVDLTNESRLAERLVSIKRALLELPLGERDAAAHSLSSGPLEVHWSAAPLTAQVGAGSEAAASLGLRLLALAPELAGQGLRVAASPAPVGDEPHQLFVSIAAPDGGWANFSIARLRGPHESMGGIVLSTSLMAFGVVLLSIFMVRWITRPLRQVADAARGAYVRQEPVRIEVDGPREIRDLAQAFNEMGVRIRKLIDDRTQTLAAVSHDLKTPLTRLRLRAEELGATSPLKAEMARDLDEMEAMLDASLTFLKGGGQGEPARDLDLASLVETVVNDYADRGHAVTFTGPSKALARGRPLLLKRAIDNLVSNAARYGKTAWVGVSETERTLVVTVEDDGPGIALDQREAVFAPFVRLEASRSRETGGVGLGLTIARDVLRSHGGDVILAARSGGGLRAVVTLPRASVPPRSSSVTRCDTGAGP